MSFKSGKLGNMGFLKIFTMLFGLFKDTKMGNMAGLMSLVVAGGMLLMQQVDAKHHQAMSKIKENEVEVHQMSKVQIEILVTLKAINESVKETKESVRDTRNKVWQIGRDVYFLKNGNHHK